MSSTRFLVCPLDDELLVRCAGRSVVLQIDHSDQVPAAREAAGRIGFHLHCLHLRSGAPLTAIPVSADWRGTPLALEVQRIGPLPALFAMLRPLRELDLRVYLSTDEARNYVGLRILASLGIECALVFGATVDWVQLTDLMTYALLGQVPHAAIDPFAHIAHYYAPQHRTDCGAVYFDDPARYLHLDRQGRVALDRADLMAGRFVLQRVEELGQLELEELEAYRLRAGAWRDRFLEGDRCARCQGWRVCLGRLAHTLPPGDAPGECGPFCAELLEVLEQHQALHRGPTRQVWRP